MGSCSVGSRGAYGQQLAEAGHDWRVPDRGGRVEEISGRDMALEVRRANESMRGKDAPRGGRGEARAAGETAGGGEGGRGGVYFPAQPAEVATPSLGLVYEQSVDFRREGAGAAGAWGRAREGSLMSGGAICIRSVVALWWKAITSQLVCNEDLHVPCYRCLRFSSWVGTDAHPSQHGFRNR